MNEFLYWFGVIAVAAIVSVNVPVLYVVKKVFSPNLNNNLISVDCIIGLAYIPGILVVSGVLDETASVHVCRFRICYNFFVNFLNRLLPVGCLCLQEPLGPHRKPKKNLSKFHHFLYFDFDYWTDVWMLLLS